MLDKLVPGTGYSVSYGSTALRSLQNQHLPALDLLVRESIQNSSDASLKIDAKSLNVNFTTGIFNPKQLNILLDDFTELLNSMFPGNQAEFIEIRDTKTTGLTGEVKKSKLIPDDHGNFFKLVFDTGKAQSQEDAGGNWGYGKSAYYRVGTGFVIFYSQVKTEVGHEQRLIITYMEDEQNPDALLKKIKPDAIGKAWWGEFDGPHGDELLPITEPDLIKDILDIFGLPLFRDEQSGTSVIIPYVDSKKLLAEVLPEHSAISDEDRVMYKWADSLENYLKLSVQKWYAPRLFNNNLDVYTGSKKLAVKVNDIAINRDAMRDFFALVQELYTTALDFNIGSKKHTSSRWGDKISCHEVRVNNLLTKPCTGHVAVARLTSTDLYGPQGGIPPHMLVRHFEGNKDPIVMFSRKLGMVIDYAIADDWTKGIVAPNNEDEMIFAFYLPDSENTLRDTLPTYGGQTLEKYLRSCEKSDHMTWYDDVKMDLVFRIKRNTVTQINHSGTANESAFPEGNASRLAGRLGRRLLPRIGYGKAGNSGGGSGGSGGSRTADCELTILDQVRNGNTIELNFALQLESGKKEAEICIFVESESGFIEADAWETDIGTKYPITIYNVLQLSAFSPVLDKNMALDNIGTGHNNNTENELATIKIQKSEKHNSAYSVKVKAHIRNIKITGCLILVASDKKYTCSVKLR